MAFEVVNYARVQNAGGKFVVLQSRDDAGSGLLLVSDFTRDFQHADIVRRWRTAAGRSPEEAGHRIAGGGWWKVEGDQLIFYGQSAAYGRFEPEWLRERVKAGTVFGETRIDVR